jgi:transposase-like protein
MTSNSKSPRCPRCGRPSKTTTSTNNHSYWCSYCQIEFEDEDDGIVGYTEPSRFAERQERWANRRKPK